MTRNEVDPGMLPLPAAGLRLGMTWAQVYNALLSGQLKGEQREGRWFVTAESIERLSDAIRSVEKS